MPARRDSFLAPPGPLGFVPSDAARRMSDILTMHWFADPRGNVGKWVAIRLSDGGSDDTVYDSVADAANAQLHYKQCAYVRIQTGGMQPKEAEIVLNYHRKVYDLGNLPPYLLGVPLRVPNRIELL